MHVRSLSFVARRPENVLHRVDRIGVRILREREA
jgi:hypothetical protein